ncbi:hypothetical protein RFI_07660 [Reticulomyxa filosa]|uniref:Uncharacterized protein n=1 Tax=Reticulomyxa filosa TaxID=46433 RepID=X6NU60_RETFI|nr:hypothetical protein RFI_07660 [Reticulomyxa filosa]|eukprot:ETO29458.1 hypothetical protein RFI_07660 [Reticulomyxa filosa]
MNQTENVDSPNKNDKAQNEPQKSTNSPLISSFENRTNELKKIDLLIRMDSGTIANIVSKKQWFLLQGKKIDEVHAKIGLVEHDTYQLKIVTTLTEVIGPLERSELNQRQYLQGLDIESTEDVAGYLGRYQQFYLWHLEVYGVISPHVLVNADKNAWGSSSIASSKNRLFITHISPKKSSIYLTLRRERNGTEREKKKKMTKIYVVYKIDVGQQFRKKHHMKM